MVSPTKDALWECDNILRSIYLLLYIDDVNIRKAVRTALNRGEAYHQLFRAIAMLNEGEFRGASEHELEVWNECARLVASVIIYYNSQLLSSPFSGIKYKVSNNAFSGVAIRIAFAPQDSYPVKSTALML